MSDRTFPPVALQLFEGFASNANFGGLHPFDWARFYAFVVHCSRHCRWPGHEEIRELCRARGFSENTARQLADCFEHGVKMLMMARYGPIPRSLRKNYVPPPLTKKANTRLREFLDSQGFASIDAQLGVAPSV